MRNQIGVSPVYFNFEEVSVEIFEIVKTSEKEYSYSEEMYQL